MLPSEMATYFIRGGTEPGCRTNIKHTFMPTTRNTASMSSSSEMRLERTTPHGGDLSGGVWASHPQGNLDGDVRL